MEETLLPGRPLSASPRVVLRRILPFVVASLVAFALALVGPGRMSFGDLAPAIALEFALVAVVFLFSLAGSAPSWVQAAPALGYYFVVYLADTGSTGPRRGLAVLGVLPVIWFALYGTRAQLWAGVAGLAAVLIAPMVFIGPPNYEIEDWHRVGTAVAVAGLIGYVVQRLVERLREGQQHERELLADVRIVAAAQRDISSDARGRVCEVACEVSGARSAAVAEVGDDGLLRITGEFGLPELRDLPAMPIDPASITGEVLASGTRHFVPDHRVEDQVKTRLPVMDAVRSILWEPILREGRAVGLLLVGWEQQLSSVADRKVEIIGLLAADAGGILERGDLLDRLEHQSHTDALTGLPNRRAWDAFIERECAVADRTGAPLCVAMIDLDHFKAFNDARGHQAGDELLQRAAESWASALRSIDLLARIGGEEFVVGLPGCDPEGALGIIERLRALTPDGQTCSAGIALRAKDEPIAELLGRADDALYTAKDDGRACARIAA
ncbi:sensor domain-containing diguanylate cyclase [Svornostia abyssi]|uniref:Sensor domain-containing diguanylate cyclase n=1 Tax=Svornostia abyssi TaxID=2898438 RepID=A0ABY5PGC5_9ACTN|nr:sensor domain-containing diguanylate cyclase [Parviterribacteraceae bacterium J379]